MHSSLQCPFSITLHNVPAVTEETSCTPRPANLAIRWPEPKKLICWVVVSAVFLELHSWNNFHSLFIYLFIYLQNHILESLSRNEKFRASVFLCIKCTAGKQKKKNNMWFIGILICFKPAKLTEFPRQPLRVKAHQRKKMKKKKSFMSREEHSQLRLKLPLGAARRKWVCPRCSVSVPVVLSNSDWSKRAEIKPMLEASLLIMRFMNRPRVCVALES